MQKIFKLIAAMVIVGVGLTFVASYQPQPAEAGFFGSLWDIVKAATPPSVPPSIPSIFSSR